MTSTRLAFAAFAMMSVGAAAGVTQACSSTEHAAASDAGTDADSSTGPPTLVALSVKGAGPLVPAFSSSINDYYVACAAATNALTVSITPSPGASGSLLQPAPATSPSATPSTKTLSVAASQAIVAVATRGNVTNEYWVRCLPSDFPPLTMTAYPDAGTPSPGYYLVGNVEFPFNGTGYAMILNGAGVPVWYHPLPGGLGPNNVDDVVDGAVTFVPHSDQGGTAFYPLEVVQLRPPAVKKLEPMGYNVDEHELRVLPNGDYVMFAWPLTSGIDLTGVKIPAPLLDGGFLEPGPGSTIQDCAVVEFDPATGKVVWEWLASQHFDPAKVSVYPSTGMPPDATQPDGGRTYDVFHCNSIDVDPANGNFLVSARNTDSVFYIDKSTKTVLWKMGGVDTSLDDTRYVSVSDPFFQQHDARLVHGWSPTCNGGSGQVSVFDDETPIDGGLARGVIYDVVVGADAGAEHCGASDGGAPGHARVAWQYKGTIYSPASGSMRFSPDGTSRIIGWGLELNDGAFTEVNAGGDKLLQLRFAAGNASYRAVKVPLTAFDLETLRQTAGQ